MEQGWSESAGMAPAGLEALASAPRETLWLTLVDRDERPFAALRLEGGPDHVPLSLAALARALVRTDAAYLFMTHNHPSGDPRPSRADIEMTRRIWRMARLLGLSLQDHHIVGRKGWFSFREHGLL